VKELEGLGESDTQLDVEPVALDEAVPPKPEPADRLLEKLEAEGAASARGERAIAQELKVMLGLDGTPPPPNAAHARDDAPAKPAEAKPADPKIKTPAKSAPPLPPKGTPISSIPPSDDGVDAMLVMTEGSPPPQRTTEAEAAASPIAKLFASLPNALPDVAPGPLGAPPSARASRPLTEGPKGLTNADVPAPSLASIAAAAQQSRDAAGPAARALASKRTRHEGVVGAIAIGMLVLGLGTVWMVRPAWLGGHDNAETDRPTTTTAAAPPTPSQPIAMAPQATRCKGTLVVSHVPNNAEVLLRVGQAPVDVDRMPVGTRLEFVATADGYAPRRATIPANAPWDTGVDGKSRFEVGVQLDRAGKAAEAAWPAGEPGSEVGGSGPPGTVHVVSTPRGAEVWLLAGLGPMARIEQLKCDADVELLVAGPGAFRKRLRATPADFAGAPDATVTLNAASEAR
jgi:hypothetical protein